MPTILITGAAGFVGGHVTREAARYRADLRLMSHRSPLLGSGPPTQEGPPPQGRPAGQDGARVVRADLTDPASLRGVCDGVDVLIHCASQIGGGVEANEAVNARGTAALVEEARRAGVARIVQLSTASVYGRGTFRGDRPEELRRNPGSPTSRTRAAAEDTVLAAGGVVLRPHLVYGEGDRWVVPGLTRMLRVLPGTVEGWPARSSAIAVPELAALLVATALAPAADLTASVYHATHPEPLPVDTLLRAVAECTGADWPDRELTVDRARAVLAEHGVPPSGLDMFTTDHVFDSTPLWSDLRRAPGAGFDTDFPLAAPWYRKTLRDG
ncbi:NAD(P)-dependent oxidoreductase [Streptomyces mirabilis]|uniref:NAD-dependent epimerase/dehydratase family protein n=1 Tax=Streptomyces mirabilis TaxID=68239 RepID=A0ABU3UPZ8_9ACTN|nr:NAD-dependent epimerase/dehydratase family protein [Streptomyces mirabilis]MCX4610338.1 NAD-dependent epimerase/dehydratase family protein [Streptomyces mirabilis]MDU8995985.1 NAD-dependent epimerase/dehydratase family protein [Streptomyces mirabilis]